MSAAVEPLPVPEPEPSPFDGWVGILVPADKPGYREVGGMHGSRSTSAKPCQTLLLVPPDLVALLRETWLDDEVPS